MTIGVQCSGKSTWARQYIKDNPEFLYLSTDELRKEFGKSEADQTCNDVIYSAMENKCINALKNNQSVILDATFIKKAWRRKYVNIGKLHADKVIAQVFIASRNELIKRLDNRVKNGGLNVPIEVIDKYIAGYQKPDYTEFDEINLNFQD